MAQQQPEWLEDMDTEERNLILHKVSALLWRYGSLKPQMMADVEENHNLTNEQVIELSQFLNSRITQQQDQLQQQQQEPLSASQQDGSTTLGGDYPSSANFRFQQQHSQGFPRNGSVGSGSMMSNGGMMDRRTNDTSPPMNLSNNPTFNGVASMGNPMGMNRNGGGLPLEVGPSNSYYGGGLGMPAPPPSSSGVMLSSSTSSNLMVGGGGNINHPPTQASVMVNGEIDHHATVGLTGLAAMNALQDYFRNLESTPVEEPTSSSGLRKGKWTLEEEEYTWRLVQHFNVGLLPIPEGTTLRSFLSSRLQCDRMRITKKFRGVCFGRKYQPCEKSHANLLALVAAEKELNVLQARFAMRDEQEQEKKSAMQEEIEACLAAPPPSLYLSTKEGSSSNSSDFAALEASVASSSVASSIVMHNDSFHQTNNQLSTIGGLNQGSNAEQTMAVRNKQINPLQAKRVASLLDKPSEALLLVLGQKYLAQLKKQARALHDRQLDSALVGDAVDITGENTKRLTGDDGDSSSSSSSSSSSNTRKRSSEDEVEALRVNEEYGKESLEPGKRVKVMACTDEDSDAGKLLLGFFNTVNQNKEPGGGGGVSTAKIVDGDDSGVVDMKQVKDIAHDQLAAAPKDGAGRHVLVADDSSSTRRFLKVQLERNGYVVDTAENGQAALESMKRQTYDIVFMDLEMPIMNGFSCSAAFREWEKNTDRDKRQPICVLSMHSGVKEKEMCAEVGVDFFEAKPARIPGLMKIAELCIKLQNK